MSTDLFALQRERFREDVLRAVQAPDQRSVRRLGDIVQHVRGLGWQGSDFGVSALSPIVDRALQYHRRAGRIGYDRVFGWYVRER